MKPAQIKAVVGLHKISDFNKNEIPRSGSDDFRPMEMTIKNLFVHPGYDCNKIADDIALMELHEPIRFGEQVSPICIATGKDSIETGANGVVYGFGWTNENQDIGIRADTLQQASVDFWDNSKCTESFRSNQKSIEITRTQLCAGKLAGGVDSCWADSGGPLVNDRNVIVGVVSTGIGCARPGLPGIYTRVTEYVDWMDGVMRK